jgi:hypothetical protein
LMENGLSVFFLGGGGRGSNYVFFSGWKKFTQLSGYYYSFKDLKTSEVFTLCYNDILMTFLVDAFKLALIAYKILDICVNILCILCLENECIRNKSNLF